LRSSSIFCVAALFGSLASSGCASSQPTQRTQAATGDQGKLVVYNGATVESEVQQAVAQRPPRPLETDDEKRARVGGLRLQASPCDLQVESVPHGIAVTFFARDGSQLEAEEIQNQVELITRVHNKIHRVPETGIEGMPEPQALHFDVNRADHAPLRALLAIPTRASWEPTDKGARLVLTSADAKDIEDLRAHVRWNAPQLLPEVMWNRTRCPDVPDDLRATR
jgi:hypothetical protein